MQSGDVLVYWPFSGRMGAEITRVNEELSDPDSQPQDILETAKAKPTIAEPDAIPCHWWLMHGIDPVKLPPIPTQLPVIAGTGLTEEKLSEETKLIKVAAMDNNVIGLTNKGHVLKYNRLQGEATYQQGQWEYVCVPSHATMDASDSRRLVAPLQRSRESTGNIRLDDGTNRGSQARAPTTDAYYSRQCSMICDIIRILYSLSLRFRLIIKHS